MPSSRSQPMTTSAPSSSPMVAITSSKLNHPVTRTRMPPACQAGARGRPRGSTGATAGERYRSVVGGDEVPVLGVPLDPAAHERAHRDDGAALAADVVQRGADQGAAQAGVPRVVVDLGVGEDDLVTAALVGGQAQPSVAVADLVAVVLGDVGHGGFHGLANVGGPTGCSRPPVQDSRRAAGPDVTVSVPGRVSPRSRQAATTASPTARASPARISAMAEPP